MKGITIVIFLMLALTYNVQAEEMNNKELSKIVNSFLCSDDIQKMSEMVEYPVFYIKETNLFDKKEFIRGIKQAKSEEGIYKLGKKCNGFQWDHVLKIKHKTEGHLVIVKSSIDENEIVTVFINRHGKITGFIAE